MVVLLSTFWLQSVLVEKERSMKDVPQRFSILTHLFNTYMKLLEEII